MGDFLKDISKIIAIFAVFIIYFFSLKQGWAISNIFLLVLLFLIPYTYFKLVSKNWKDKNLAEKILIIFGGGIVTIIGIWFLIGIGFSILGGFAP